MQFLAPLWLALAGAAAVPLLLHLLRRRTGVRVPFPAARYLARAEQEHSAQVKLRNWLLLALRVLALVCVALAAARPLVGARAGVGGRAPAALAVVLDNSASTAAVAAGRPVLDGLREQALGALARAGGRDRVWLVTADGRVTGGDADAVRAAVRAAPALAGRGDLPAAAARATALAGGAGLGPGAVVVVTDGQATAWTRPARAASAGRGPARVAVVSPGTPAPADRAVLDAAAVPARWSPAGQVTGQLSAPGDWQVALADSAGRRVASARGVADAAGARVRVTLRPDARGWLAGALSTAPDEWRASDVRHFAALVADPPAATADGSAGPFAAAAVAALQADGRVRAGAGASGVRVAEPEAAGRLPAVLVAPGDGARLGAANQALARLGVPWRFGALVAAPARARLRGDDALGTGDAGPAAADSLATVTVARRWRLERVGAAPADTLADVGGDAWAVAGEGYVLLASPLDPAWTDLPVRARFVPWLDAAIARRLAGGGRAERASPGATVRAPAGADALTGPFTPADGADQERAAPPATTPVAAGAATVPGRAGVYFWLRDGARVGALVADPEPDELALARLSDAALAARVGAQGRATRDGAAAAEALLEGAGRRPAAGLFAAAALLALAAEGLAARPRRPRAAAPAAPRPAARAA